METGTSAGSREYGCSQNGRTDAQKNGEVRPGNLEILGAAVIGVMIRVAIFRIYGLLQGDLKNYTAEVADLCLRVVAAA